MRVRILILLAAAVAFVACASGGGGAAPATSQYSDAPGGSALAKVSVGMNDTQVRKALGDPDNANAYTTVKSWIPLYYGPDTHRTDWMYSGQGRVVFSRNPYSGGLEVIHVLHNPNELE